MNCKTIRHTLFLAAMVFASSTFAGTDIMKCTDASGHVTLTDQPCTGEAAQVVLSGPALAAPAQEQAFDPDAPAPSPAVSDGTSRYQLASLPPPRTMRAAPYTRVQAPGRSLARDVATLKEARRTMMLLDSSMAASRQRGLAANP